MIHVAALNEMSLHAMEVDFAGGTLELFSEAAIADGYIKGCLKPMFINTELIREAYHRFEKIWRIPCS